MPEAVLLRQQHGSWERTRRAPRPQPDGRDAHRAMLPDHARYPPQGRAARVRCTTKPIAKKSTTGSLPPAVPLAIITRTFRPWAHTSDDSYIYQLSLVVATVATDCIFFCFAAPLMPLSDTAIRHDGIQIHYFEQDVRKHFKTRTGVLEGSSRFLGLGK